MKPVLEKPCGIQAGVRTRMPAAAPASAAVAYETGSCGVVSGSTAPKIASGVEAARLQALEPLRIELHARELPDAEQIEKSFGRGLHGRQREREADDGDRRGGGEPPLEVGRRRDARDGVWREGTQRRAQSRCEFRRSACFFRSRKNWSSICRYLYGYQSRRNVCTTRCRDRADVRFAQTRELGDGAVRSLGPVLQRDELLLALRQLLQKRAEAGEIRVPCDFVVRRVLRCHFFRRLERQMRPLRAQMIDRDVARDAEQPRREAREIAPVPCRARTTPSRTCATSDPRRARRCLSGSGRSCRRAGAAPRTPRPSWARRRPRPGKVGSEARLRLPSQQYTGRPAEYHAAGQRQ